jgi:hypothetical protein
VLRTGALLLSSGSFKSPWLTLPLLSNRAPTSKLSPFFSSKYSKQQGQFQYEISNSR